MRVRSMAQALLVSTLLMLTVPLAAMTSTVGSVSAGSLGYQSVAAAGSDLLCGIRANDSLDCWGRSQISVADHPDGAFQGISASRRAACGLRADQGMECWGRWYSDVAHDSRVIAPSGAFVKLDLADEQGCAITTAGQITCFGGFEEGSAGSGVRPIEGSFIDVAAIHDDYGGCGIRVDGRIACWGDDTWGQASPPSGTFSDIAAGRMTLCAIETGGELACWGRGLYGAANPPAGRYSTLAIGGDTGCAIAVEQRQLSCWGADLGEPPDVAAATLAIGDNIAGMIGTNGVVHTWGEARLWPVWGGWDVARPRNGFGAFRIIGDVPAALERGVPIEIVLGTTPIEPTPEFRMAAGELPRGLELTPDGRVVGTADTAGVWGPISIVADNGEAPLATRTFQMAVVVTD